MSLVIGIAGTAKNTGKTTTMSTVLDELYDKDISVALTSIGYDGEEIDNITGLPKPRIYVKEDTFLVTAEKCLEAQNAKCDILEKTNITTPLGAICIAKVVKAGLAVIAGPNKGSQLRYIVNKMTDDYMCKIILVDGALNRISPMVETDGIIIATGASRNINIDTLAEEANALFELLNIPEVSGDVYNLEGVKKIALIPKESEKKVEFLKYGSLIDYETTNQILDRINDLKAIYVPALVSESALKKLNESIGSLWADKQLILKDSIKLITGGKPQVQLEQVKNIIRNGGKVRVLKNIPLLAISVNPFYPKYRFKKGVYEPGYVDKQKLLASISNAVDVPVVDIKAEGSSKLMKIILSYTF